MRHAFQLKLALITLACAFGGNSGAAEAPAGDSLMIGLGAAYVPEYAGSDDSRVVPVPFLERSFANGFFLSTRRGLGYQTNVGAVNLSGALAYGGARDERKRTFAAGSDALRGMGDIDGGLQGVLTASYRLGKVGLSIGTTQAIGKRENGSTYTVGGSVPLYSGTNDQVGLGASAVYGDNKHAQTYFGVSDAQSLRSGYKAYRAKAGFESVSAAASWDHVIDKNWSTYTAAGFTHLTGDAADSPLTRRKTTPMVMTGFSYKF
ncbi:MAG TPA: MipA/OmpV family protein [Duganella sp.]|jgi:outer membrane scaffolding protein for murein synthesis (MipA/OmpV family)